MRLAMILAAVALCALAAVAAQQPSGAARETPRPTGVRLEDLTWMAAQQKLRPDTVVVLPLGAGAVEHGPHLRLGTDAALAAYLTRRLLDTSNIVVAPAIPYHHFPAFDEYPGSTSLSAAAARDLTADVARSLSRHGPRRFYVLDASAANVEALADTATVLAEEGILLRFTDLPARLEHAARSLRRQAIGGHADEIETSMMLYIDPSSVDMQLAAREYGRASSPFRLTRRDGSGGTYSPTGILGDATLATRAKGRAIVEELVAAIRVEIEDTRRAALPVAGGRRAAVSRAGRGGAGGRPPTGAKPDECLPGDDRTIRAVGSILYTAWMHHDAQRISELWGPEGDMVHPDGFIEGSAQAIRQNRAALFKRPEYRHTRHSLLIGQIRCITGDVAVADAKWELTGLADPRGRDVPSMSGLATLVLERRTGGWTIEAYRYTVNPPDAGRPMLFDRPGIPDTIR